MIKSTTLLVLGFLAVMNTSAQMRDFPTANFAAADSVASFDPAYPLTDLTGLTHKLTNCFASEEEKFRAIYKWICNNIEYDHSLYTENREKRTKFAKERNSLNEWNAKFTSRVVQTLTRHHRTVCSGYASLLKELCSLAGLNCVIIDGYGRTAQSNIRGTGQANHSWNAVELNGKWYLCDVTWSSGAYDTQRQVYVKNFEECYFLADPEQFIRNHYPLEREWTHTRNQPALTQFLNRPLFYVNAFHLGIGKSFPDDFDLTVTKGETVTFKFNCQKKIETAALIVNGLNHQKSLQYFPDDDLFAIEHQFNNKGKRTVHIMLNNNYTFTYTVTVQ
jgi:transglutaminase/protease-like cytokinesis protein 3